MEYSPWEAHHEGDGLPDRFVALKKEWVVLRVRWGTVQCQYVEDTRGRIVKFSKTGAEQKAAELNGGTSRRGRSFFDSEKQALDLQQVGPFLSVDVSVKTLIRKVTDRFLSMETELAWYRKNCSGCHSCGGTGQVRGKPRGVIPVPLVKCKRCGGSGLAKDAAAKDGVILKGDP